ncbi:MAG TPA: hypothetical protein ENI79_01245 [Rhodospirillales bacterium]|nr:hypothetical protein [Rhodospirillales bacterium]
MQGATLRKYGVQATIPFTLYTADGSAVKPDAVHAGGDTKIMKDEGTEANTTNAFADEGQGYSIVLSAAEMQAARIVIYIVDQSATPLWLPTSINVETYGNASAQHAFDLNTTGANQVLGAVAGSYDVAGSVGEAILDAQAMGVGKKIVTHDDGVAKIYDQDGSTLRKTLTPTKDVGANKTTVTPT